MPTIYTLMHICTYLRRPWKYTYALTCIHTHIDAHVWIPIFQQKGLCTYGQTIYAYTILYSCIQIVHHIHTSYISHIQTPYSVCTCTYMSKIWTALSVQTSSPMDIYIHTHTHTHIFVHTVCLRLAFLIFFFIFLRQGLPMSLWSPGWPGTHCVDLASLKLRDGTVSVSQVLELKMCTITPRPRLWGRDRNL